MLSKLGQIATARFAEKLAPLKIRPKHCGLLAAAASSSSASQEDLSRALGLVPSAIVGIVDDLEHLGAVRRVTDEDNRRRYSIELTKQGRTLLGRCTDAAQEVDDEILASLTAAHRASLTGFLKTVGATLGLFPRPETVA